MLFTIGIKVKSYEIVAPIDSTSPYPYFLIKLTNLTGYRGWEGFRGGRNLEIDKISVYEVSL